MQPTRKDRGQIRPAHRRRHQIPLCIGSHKRASLIEQISSPVLRRWNGNLPGVHALRRPGPLIIPEKENRILANGSANRPAKLILIERPARRRKEIPRIQIGIPHKLENIPVKRVRPRFGNHINLPAAKFPILSIEIIRQNAKLGDRIKIRNNRRAHIHVFFHVAAVHDEAIRKFPLSINRNRSRIQIARRRKHARAHILHRLRRNRSHRRNSRLQRQQIRKAPPVQRHRRHLRPVNHFAHLRAGGFHVELIVNHGHHIRPRS